MPLELVLVGGCATIGVAAAAAAAAEARKANLIVWCESFEEHLDEPSTNYRLCGQLELIEANRRP